MYHTNGILNTLGYKEIDLQIPFQKGDISITESNSAHPDGHIAMWSGEQWISDFIQQSEFVFNNNQPPVHYYRYYGNEILTDNEIVFTYAVKIKGEKILPEVRNGDFAGIEGEPITDIAIKVNKGSVKYRVHVENGNWLGYVTGYNWGDYNNGYAGEGKTIDLVEIIYNERNDMPLYRVSTLNSNYYPWQKGNLNNSQNSGFAGALGKAIDRLQIKPN